MLTTYQVERQRLYVSELEIIETMLMQLFFGRKPWALIISVVVILGTNGH